eukprot:309881-Amphidinium_carterae.1
MESDVATHRFVHNLQSDTWHRVRVAGAELPSSSWRSRCGWRFAVGSTFACSRRLPSKALRCAKCFEFEASLGASTEQSSGDEGGVL